MILSLECLPFLIYGFFLVSVIIKNKIMEKGSPIKKINFTGPKSYVFWVCLALILGIAVSFLCFRFLVSKPEIGIIRVYGPILDQYRVDEIKEQIRYAKDTRKIQGVVLEIDSSGGEAQLIQELYFCVLGLREEKPVVASINRQATSGGYYIAVASNQIYAKPDSILGSIGAWAALPYPEMVMEDILPTGPFKDTGMTRRKAVDHLEMLRQNFIQAVTFQRGERLDLGPVELGRAEVYVGLEGLRLGLIDYIGSGFEASEKAAELAGVRNYGITDISEKFYEEPPEPQYPDWMVHRGQGGDTVSGKESLLPAYYYLMQRLPEWEE